MYNKLLFILLVTFSGLVAAVPVRIAIVLPLHGSYKDYGAEMLAGAYAAVDTINKSGGLLGSRVELIPYDDRCSTNLAESVSLQISKDSSITAVVGHACSSATLAAMKNYAAAGKLVITPSSVNSRITQQGFSNIFRMCGRDIEQAEIAANFMLDVLGAKRIAILRDDEIYGVDLADHLINFLAIKDVTPVWYKTVPKGTKKLKSIFNQLEENQIDAIYYAGMYVDVANLVDFIYTEKKHIPVVAADTLVTKNFVYDVGNTKAASSVMFSFHKDFKLQSNVRFGQQKMQVEGYGLYAYAALEVIAAAVEATKQRKGIKLARWIHQNKVKTVLGEKCWDTNGDLFDIKYNMYLWQSNSEHKKLYY